VRYLQRYKFDLEKMRESATLRILWNAIYLNECVTHHTDCNLYFATNNFANVKKLVKRMKALRLNHDQVNVLVSYAALPKKSNDSMLDKLITLKNSINEDKH
jgi:hypothetical protein